MRLPIVHVRILIFAFSIACLTIDTFSLGSIYRYLIYSFNTQDDEILDTQRIVIFSLINDALSLLISGYYLIRIEYIWNNPPKIVDYIICGIQLALWIIYAGLQSKFIINFSNVLITISFIYGILNVILYFVLGIFFIEFKRRLRKFGVDKLTPLSHTNNNSGV